MHQRTSLNQRYSIEISIYSNHVCYLLVVAEQIRAALELRRLISVSLSFRIRMQSQRLNVCVCLCDGSRSNTVELENKKMKIQQKYEILRYL